MRDTSKAVPKPRGRRNPTARVGNYASEIDTTGMDESMKKTLSTPKPMKRRGNWLLKILGVQ